MTVSFDGFRALNDLSLTVQPGEMRAIIGPNGAGKTTMMDVVTGKTRPDDGDVFSGHRIRERDFLEKRVHVFISQRVLRELFEIVEPRKVKVE